MVTIQTKNASPSLPSRTRNRGAVVHRLASAMRAAKRRPVVTQSPPEPRRPSLNSGSCLIDADESWRSR